VGEGIEVRLIKESHYNQTLDLVETIPGATTIQIVVAIGTFSTNAIGGLLALFFYALPSALILLALGLWFREYEYKGTASPSLEDMNILIQIALYGIRSANVALIVQVCFKMIWDHVENRLDAGLVVMSAVAVLLFPNPQTLLTMLVIGGLLMLMLEYNIENREDKSEDNHEEPIIKEPKYVVLIHETINTKNCGQLSAMFGSKALHMYIIIWMLILWFHG
jgi:chromate transport protein ChrA